MPGEETVNPAVPPVAEAPGSTPFLTRLAGSAFTFAVYFGCCAAIAYSGGTESAARPPAPALIWFLGVCFGLVTIAVDSGAAYPWRELAGKIPVIGKGLYTERREWDDQAKQWDWVPDWGLLTCAMCAGMWAGSLLAAVGLTVFPISLSFGGAMRDLVAHGLMGSAWCWIVHSILSRLGAYS